MARAIASFWAPAFGLEPQDLKYSGRPNEWSRTDNTIAECSRFIGPRRWRADDTGRRQWLMAYCHVGTLWCDGLWWHVLAIGGTWCWRCA